MTVADERAVVLSCGGDDLVGILHAGRGVERDIGILIVVGGPQYRVGSHRQFVLMARGFAEDGFAAFRFDYRGMGDSSGDRRTFESVGDDIRCAIDAFMGSCPSLRRVVVLGLCDAASAASMYAHDDPRVAGLILINPWVRTDASEARTVLRHHYARRLLQRSFWAKVISGEFRFAESMRSLTESLRRSVLPRGGALPVQAHFVDRMSAGLESFRGRILLLLSEDDLTAREFESLSAGSPKWRRLLSASNVTTHALRQADHTFSSFVSLHEAVEVTLLWLRADDMADRDPRLTFGR